MSKSVSLSATETLCHFMKNRISTLEIDLMNVRKELDAMKTALQNSEKDLVAYLKRDLNILEQNTRGGKEAAEKLANTIVDMNLTRFKR